MPGIALTTICVLGSGVPEIIKSVEFLIEDEGNKTVNPQYDEDMEKVDVRKVKLYFYAGLSCIGFLGAAFMIQKKEEGKEEEEGKKEAKKSVRQHLSDCIRQGSEVNVISLQKVL